MKKIDSCFVISPIGNPGSEIRRHADQVFNHIISPVTEQLGISPDRSDRIEQSGKINEQIFDRLLSADVVIADLSKHNPNVFYELAIRHMTKKPCLHLISQSDGIPFDVHSFRAIFFDLTDLDSISVAKTSLEKQLSKLAGSRSSPFGKEFEERFEKHIVGHGCEHYARISVAFPEISHNGKSLPLLSPSMDSFNALSTDDLSLQLLMKQLELQLNIVKSAVSVRFPDNDKAK